MRSGHPDEVGAGSRFTVARPAPAPAPAVVALLVLVSLPLSQGCGGAPPRVERPPPALDVGPVETEPEARPLPKLAPSLQRIVEAAGGDWPHEPVEIDQATCRKLSRWPGDLMTCWLEPLARGSAARLIIQTLCEADYCDWEAYLFADGSDEPLQPAPDELSRDHVLAYAEVGVFVGGEGLEESSKRLIVIERATRRQQPFADCFSPSVSPGGQWILCRDRRGAVLAVPVEGGEPQPVVVPQIDPALVLWQPRFWAVVSKVRFPDPKHMKYKIDLMPELPPKVERHRERIEGPFVIEWQE